MNRYLIVVGDAPACGGSVLPYEGTPVSTILDHRIALVGGRVFCAVCESVGSIAKAGGPYRTTFCGAEQALEGDVVVCRCPVPSPLVASRQRMSYCDDRGGTASNYSLASTGVDWYRADPIALTASKRLVDGLVRNLPEADGTKTICRGMSDDIFFVEMMKNRDRAIYLVSLKLNHLSIWNQSAQDHVRMWFGRTDEETRDFLRKGLTKIVDVLSTLPRANFVRYSDEFAGRIACEVDRQPGVVAGVCKTDARNRIIGIAQGFCELQDERVGNPSKVATLIHEISHYYDVFDADDLQYGHYLSRLAAELHPDLPRKNADSFSGYVMWGTHHGV